MLAYSIYILSRPDHHRHYTIILISLNIAAFLFVGIDWIYLKLILELIENKPLNKVKLSQLKERENEFKDSLFYANIPAMIGLSIILSVWFVLGKQEELIGFIAGGSAMHMVFGNIIVAIGLRKSS